MSVVIGFENVSKRYRIGSGSRDLRELIAGFGRPKRKHNDEFWALREVSFAVERGRVLGIIGHNGAGKTTVLKLLSGITRPTSGKVHVDGRISALIELGAGFHPDLTGRENVYLNATILGLKKKEIDQRFERIVE